MNNNIIQNRSELLFLYDIKDANPNGDPLDENKPRIDEETGVNIVTDVRLKRTIRDYLMNFKKEDIFVREITDKDGYIQDAKLRAKDFLKDEKDIDNKEFNEQKTIIKNKIVKECIDVRLFGATIPLDLSIKKKNITGSITLTGPVQFRIGRSMHRVEMKHIKGTGAFASKQGATQKTFREEDILPYSLINFYGIINENAAIDTQLAEEDIDKLLDGIWNGTLNLISRSKAGQMPRLLLKVEYKENNYHIGDLDKLIKLKSSRRDEELRDIEDLEIDARDLIQILNKNKDKILSIKIRRDDRLKMNLDALDIKLEYLIFDSDCRQ